MVRHFAGMIAIGRRKMRVAASATARTLLGIAKVNNVGAIVACGRGRAPDNLGREVARI